MDPHECNDSDPLFVAEFYKNLKILSQDLFRRTVSADAKQISRQASVSQTNPATIKKSVSHRNFVDVDEEQAVDYYTSTNLHERVKQYAAEGGVPAEFVERYYEQTKKGDSQVNHS